MKQLLEFEKPIQKLRDEIEAVREKHAAKPSDKLAGQIADLEAKLDKLQRDTHANLNPWQRVQISRHLNRPFMLDYVKLICEEFVELHGDRHIGDDNAMPAGFATIGGQRVAIIGHQKGRDTKRNIAEAIAFNLREMMTIKTPIVAIVIGEGGSGGALGIGIADRVLMMENAYYSVISPEGCAAILWKDRKHAPEAATALKLSAPDLKQLGIIDGVIPEPLGGAHNDAAGAAEELKKAILSTIDDLTKTQTPKLLEDRYQKFRALGQFTEN